MKRAFLRIFFAVMSFVCGVLEWNIFCFEGFFVSGKDTATHTHTKKSKLLGSHFDLAIGKLHRKMDGMDIKLKLNYMTKSVENYGKEK